MERKEITVSKRLANNIEMLKNDDHYLDNEKANVADALYGISLAEYYSENNANALEKLKVAKDTLFSYMFYLDIMIE